MDNPVFTGTILFRKTVQNKPFESEVVEITQSVTDGDDYESMVDMLREMCYRHLGRSSEFVAHAPPPPVATKEATNALSAERNGAAYIEDLKANEALSTKQSEEASGSVIVPANEEAPKKRTRRTKAQIAEDKAAEEAAQLGAMAEDGVSAEIDDVSVVENASSAKISRDDIFAYAQEAAAAVGGKEVKKLLQDRFGTDRIGRLEEADYPEIALLMKTAANKND